MNDWWTSPLLVKIRKSRILFVIINHVDATNMAWQQPIDKWEIVLLNNASLQIWLHGHELQTSVSPDRRV